MGADIAVIALSRPVLHALSGKGIAFRPPKRAFMTSALSGYENRFSNVSAICKCGIDNLMPAIANDGV